MEKSGKTNNFNNLLHLLENPILVNIFNFFLHCNSLVSCTWMGLMITCCRQHSATKKYRSSEAFGGRSQSYSGHFWPSLQEIHAAAKENNKIHERAWTNICQGQKQEQKWLRWEPQGWAHHTNPANCRRNLWSQTVTSTKSSQIDFITENVLYGFSTKPLEKASTTILVDLASREQV